MEIKNNINSRPFTPVSPGSILKDELEARCLPVEVFAEKIGLDKLTLEELLNGKLILSSEIANSLDKALGIPASFWLSLQSAYEEDFPSQGDFMHYKYFPESAARQNPRKV